jgi:AraC-like DNA-binding protein/quercetin dioxygenase-like cupin family protein
VKVKPFQILKPLDENLIVQVDRLKGFYNHLHQHSEIQLSLVVQGNGKLLIGDSIHPFNPGDFFAIGPNSPHLFKAEIPNQRVHMISLFFTEKTFGEGFFQLSDLKELRPFFKIIMDGFRPLLGQIEIAHLVHQFPKAPKLKRVLLFLQLLELCCKIDKKPLTNFIYPKQTGLLAGERLQVVFDYVLHNFQKEIKLDSVADLVHMTPNAFCRFFKQRTNKTLFQFLIELRIEHAGQLLQRHKDLSIAEISERSGFNSISNFNRKFLGIKGMKPSQYATRAVNKEVLLTDSYQSSTTPSL